MSTYPDQFNDSWLHGHVLDFGKHRGVRLVHVPVNYLLWMANTEGSHAEMAQAELRRRGTMLPTFDISGHAIDRASLYCFDLYRNSRIQSEGLHAWLARLGAEALTHEPDDKGRTHYAEMVWVFDRTLPSWPALKSVRREKERQE